MQAIALDARRYVLTNWLPKGRVNDVKAGLQLVPPGALLQISHDLGSNSRCAYFGILDFAGDLIPMCAHEGPALQHGCPPLASVDIDGVVFGEAVDFKMLTSSSVVEGGHL